MLTEHRWIAKALVQKSVSKAGLLPVYHRAQRIAGRLKNFHPHTRIEYAGKLAADVGLAKLDGAVMVEIGTGWVPIVPMGLYLLGAREVHSFDLTRHLQPDLAMRSVALLPDCFSDLERRSGCPAYRIVRRHAELAGCMNWMEVSERMGFHYSAPEDVTRCGLPDGSVDIVYSNLVLEHVTPSALEEILSKAHRILKPGGVCWHGIDCTDHYAATHKGLSPINFLRYGERFWSLIGQNDILYQNRLRRSDYLRAFSNAGFEVEKIVESHLKDCSAAILSDRFKQCDEKDVSCLSMRVVLIKG